MISTEVLTVINLTPHGRSRAVELYYIILAVVTSQCQSYCYFA